MNNTETQNDHESHVRLTGQLGSRREKITGAFLFPSENIPDGLYWYSMPHWDEQRLIKVESRKGKKFVIFSDGLFQTYKMFDIPCYAEFLSA